MQKHIIRHPQERTEANVQTNQDSERGFPQRGDPAGRKNSSKQKRIPKRIPLKGRHHRERDYIKEVQTPKIQVLTPKIQAQPPKVEVQTHKVQVLRVYIARYNTINAPGNAMEEM